MSDPIADRIASELIAEDDGESISLTDLPDYGDPRRLPLGSDNAESGVRTLPAPTEDDNDYL